VLIAIPNALRAPLSHEST